MTDTTETTAQPSRRINDLRSLSGASERGEDNAFEGWALTLRDRDDDAGNEW